MASTPDPQPRRSRSRSGTASAAPRAAAAPATADEADAALRDAWNVANKAETRLHNARQVPKAAEMGLQLGIALVSAVGPSILTYMNTSGSKAMRAVYAGVAGTATPVATTLATEGSKWYHSYVHASRDKLNDAANECKRIQAQIRLEYLLGERDPSLAKEKAEDFLGKVAKATDAVKAELEWTEAWQPTLFGLVGRLEVSWAAWLGLTEKQPKKWKPIDASWYEAVPSTTGGAEQRKLVKPKFVAKEVIDMLTSAEKDFRKKSKKYEIPGPVGTIVGALPDQVAQPVKVLYGSLSAYATWRKETYKKAADAAQRLEAEAQQKIGGASPDGAAVMEVASRMQKEVFDECNKEWDKNAREAVKGKES